MSSPQDAVLYDAQGPQGRRRTVIGSVVAAVLLAVIAFVVIQRLAAQDQFSAEKWAPLIDPRTDEFPLVWQLLLAGLRATLIAAALSITFSLVLGTLLAVGRIMSGRFGRIPLVGLIELLRGLPVVLSIFFAARVLPDLGVSVAPLPGEDGLWYVVIGLTAYNMVIVAEIVRAGVAALPRGQSEAAQAMGLSGWQTMRLILLPQAFRIMLPALISQLVVVLKDTSLAGLLGIYTELLRQGNLIVQTLKNPFQVYLIVGLIFVLLNGALSRLAIAVEKRLSRSTPRADETQAAQPDAAVPAAGVGGGA